MTIARALFSNRTEEWPTPTSFFAELNKDFNFTLARAPPKTMRSVESFSQRRMTGSHRIGATKSSFAIPLTGKRCAHGPRNAMSHR